MSKAIIQDPTVINYITKTLTNTENDYHVGCSEWSDSTRSDVVLEPKSFDLGLPPIIIEIQQMVDKAFMKRAVGYCLQASKRYNVDPIILIICVNSLDSYVASRIVASDVYGGYDFLCDPWAANCIVLSKESLNKDNVSSPLDPLFALGLFFTSQALSIMSAPFANDPTIQYLYSLVTSREENCSNNIALSLLESQHREYEKLLTLVNTAGSSDV
ncbi:uncharacterized protein BX663DRAFT_491428 [Cokeromyces recurvatus]|uniref:uncharacterized protein n=1 Tax=Cokeromyces recurvatus TaxID=90255 RepID=UPI002220FABF|nr:uncharacterized protein BX663DRAFT_491428 [Cokeromyces recurvatus]KAI7907605.1 hypothetical protein BX663DRAFT_491428 [Cokeromyces recurvatus]